MNKAKQRSVKSIKPGDVLNMTDIYEKKCKLKEEAKEIKIPLTISVSLSQLESVISSAINGGGIAYWCTYGDFPKELEKLKNSLYAEECILTYIYNKGTVPFVDVNTGKRYDLTLDKLLKGISLNMLKNPTHCNLNNVDGEMADCIFQYTFFGEIVYQ